MLAQNNELTLVLAFGTAAMLLFFLFVMVFVFLYQRKAIKHQLEITEQELQSKRDMLFAAVEAQEATFREIALELHDGLGPYYSLLKQNLFMVERQMTKANLPVEDLNEGRQMLTEIAEQSRHLSHRLYPSVLGQFGLPEAIEHYADKTTKANTLRVQLHMTGHYERLPLETEQSLYRIFQEVCINANKYANASLLTVHIETDAKKFVMKMSDNGRGFNAEAVKAKPGIGVRNIYARCELMNAKADLYSAHGKGTTWIITLEK